MQCVVIAGTHRGKYLAKVLTNKRDVYAGTHTLARNTLLSKFELVP